MTMKKLSIVSTLSCLVLLVGCAPPQRQAQQYQNAPVVSDAQRQNNLYIAAFNQGAKNNEKCLSQIKQSDDAKLVYKEVLFDNVNSANKLELMGSKSYINAKQATALKKLLVDAEKCRAQKISDVSNIPYMADMFRAYDAKMDIMYSKLLAKSITIGEANQTRLQIIQENNAKMTEAKQRLAKDLSDRHNQEVSQNIQRQNLNAQQRAADAAAAAAASQQQQQLFNNAQQLLRGDGGGQTNCYQTPGVPGGVYCR
jgi:hypothetical protein